MSTTSQIEGFAPALLLIAVLLLIVVRRTLQMVRGTPVSTARLFGFAILYLLLFVLIVLGAAFQLPWYSPGVDLGVLVLAAYLATHYVRRNVKLERRPPTDEYYYQLNPIIPLIFVVLFVVRLAIDFTLLGGASAFGPSPSGSSALPAIAPGAALILVVVDALFAFSAGLLVGRSVGVYLEYRERMRADAAAPAPRPLP